MSLSQLINRNCTIIRKTSSGSIDELGNVVDAETSVATVCEIQQTTADEVQNTEWGSAEYKGFFPAGTELDTGDVVEVDDLGTLEVVGLPARRWNPRIQTEQFVRAWLHQTAGAEDSS